MPELAILEQEVLTGIIEKYTPPPDNLGQSLFSRISHPYTSAKWDVIQGKQRRAHFTMPNREGKIVEQLGVGSKTASFAYVREKKAFEPTTLRWLRAPGEMSTVKAEECVRRELADLNNRIERLVESTCWDALKGTITINEPDVVATVDLGVPGANKPSSSVTWEHQTSTVYDADIIGDLKAWKKLILQATGFPATDVFISSATFNWVYLNAAVRYLFTDRVREELLSKGTITGLLGLNWHLFDGSYANDSDALIQYVPDDYLIMIAKGANSFKILEGLSADLDAPDGHTGKFSKSWESKDPSSMQILVEYSFIPVLMDAAATLYAHVKH